MLISTHGDAAEAKAALSLAEARQAERSGDIVTWNAIIEQLAHIRLENKKREG